MTQPQPSTIEREHYCPPYQDLQTLAANICCGESTIERWVSEGKFPEPRKVGGKRLWCWKEVDRFLSPPDNVTPIQQGEVIRENTKRLILNGR